MKAGASAKSSLNKGSSNPILAELKSIHRTIREAVSPRIELSGDAKRAIEFARTNNARFVKLDEKGLPLLASAKAWSAVRDTRLGIDWSADDVGAAAPFADAKKACEELVLCGTKSWRLPTVEELFLLADRTKREPAIDKDFFPTCKSAWYWTSTPYAAISGNAWFVYFYNGSSDWYDHDYHNLVRACRPSQG